MSTGQLTYTGHLVMEECCRCGSSFAIPVALDARARSDHTVDFYCPLGHGQHFIGETEAEKLRRQLNWERDTSASLRGQRDQLTASLRTTRGHITRLRKRVTAGACPFGCHRHFADLERHVAAKHPGASLDGES